MSPKLEQALMRLDKVVEALEQAPTPKSASSADEGMKAEIHAIRGLVDEAMTLLSSDGLSSDGQSSSGEPS